MTEHKKDSRFSFVDNKRSITSGKSDRIHQINKDLTDAANIKGNKVKRDKSPKSPVNIIFNKATGDWLQMATIPDNSQQSQLMNSEKEKNFIDQFPKYLSCVPKDDKTIKRKYAFRLIF